MADYRGTNKWTLNKGRKRFTIDQSEVFCSGYRAENLRLGKGTITRKDAYPWHYILHNPPFLGNCMMVLLKFKEPVSKRN